MNFQILLSLKSVLAPENFGILSTPLIVCVCMCVSLYIYFTVSTLEIESYTKDIDHNYSRLLQE